MPKNIIVCSDGTGNSGGKGNGTNVWRVFEAVNRASTNPRQVAFYDDGVGTESFKPLKIAGGAFGYGLARNVRQLYKEICRIYEPGDRLFYFGFSRGAFTVRTLMGWILSVGLINPQHARDNQELDQLVGDSYRAPRSFFRTYPQRLISSKPSDRHKKKIASKLFDLTDNQKCALGHFIGVWDTVDAVGFPVAFVADAWNTLVYRFKFPDYKLSPFVRHARHALAIDDERKTFHPLLWDEAPDENKADAGMRSGQQLQQVWFSGMHSNIGGGYPQDGMAYVSLTWMMDAARQAGLEFTQGLEQLYRERANPMEKMYNSRGGLGMYYRFAPRSISYLSEKNSVDVVVHHSVLQRTRQSPAGYVPRQIPNPHKIWASPKPTNDPKILNAIDAGMKDKGIQQTDEIAKSLDSLRKVLQWFIVILSFYSTNDRH